MTSNGGVSSRALATQVRLSCWQMLPSRVTLINASALSEARFEPFFTE
jgi:hypothetical protein